MTGPGQPGALQRWRAWWLSEPARGTANPVTARWAAILMRVRCSRVMAIVAPVLPALFVAAVAAAQLAHRSGSARSPLAAAIVFSVLLAVPLVWRRRYPAATFGFLAAVALIQWVTGTRLVADVALLIALYAMFEHCSLGLHRRPVQRCPGPLTRIRPRAAGGQAGAPNDPFCGPRKGTIPCG